MTNFARKKGGEFNNVSHVTLEYRGAIQEGQGQLREACATASQGKRPLD